LGFLRPTHRDAAAFSTAGFTAIGFFGLGRGNVHGGTARMGGVADGGKSRQSGLSISTARTASRGGFGGDFSIAILGSVSMAGGGEDGDASGSGAGSFAHPAKSKATSAAQM